MKITLHFFLFALCLPFLIISCGPDEGCTSAFATNYDETAIEDCCCTYDVENAISEIVGSYSNSNIDCTIKKERLNFTIKEDPDIEYGVILSFDELYITDDVMKGEFIDGVFRFLYTDDNWICDQRATLSIRSTSSGFVFDFKNTFLSNGQSNFCSFSNFSCDGSMKKI